MNDKCGEYSILEIWKYDMEIIKGLTQQDIINAINVVTESPVFGYDTNFTDYLGGVNRYGCIMGPFTTGLTAVTVMTGYAVSKW